ncbi:MAG: hypothetical protein KME32_30325 [Mojavia pulchra JT2-VF2]|jgi:hypothetical protein|uniref:Uncharacterized protein n=1 Tax=Mojavia pulchra JT2-VF2 TaxID=287848 RepID=A0A951UJI6_9NOST|nr:hypothetical protein [Mojavia pulchra JT2-VF2]
MRVWLACFLVLFALAELFDWLQEFTLPLPIYILGGAFLAVASNYDKIIGSYLSNTAIEPSPPQPQLESPTQFPSSIALTMVNPVEDEQQSEV